jgi:hypothetical protein
MPRAYWKGYLRLPLVTCPIELFPATSQADAEKLRALIQRVTRSFAQAARTQRAAVTFGAARVGVIVGPPASSPVMQSNDHVRKTCHALQHCSPVPSPQPS